jgi:hypothetical protein
MSNLLKEAMVDAKALREAALKNAESTIINKYSEEVRSTLEQLLEQEEDALGGFGDLGGGDAALTAEAEEPVAEGEDVDPTIPLAATDGLAEEKGENLSNLQEEGEDVPVTINLDALREAIEQLVEGDENEGLGDEEVIVTDQQLLNMLAEEEDEKPDYLDLDGDGDKDEPMKKAAEEKPMEAPLAEGEPTADDDVYASPTASLAAAAQQDADDRAMKDTDDAGIGPVNEGEELLEVTEEMIADLVEKLTVDTDATLAGWAGRSSESMRWEMMKAFAKRRSTDIADELADLKKAQEELVFENKQLKSQSDKYKKAVSQLQETLSEVNLSNAHLLYTNRVLRNTSLNERQKTQLVEAISKAGSALEAKAIYGALQSTTSASIKTTPRSLNEAISSPSNLIRAARKTEPKRSDSVMDRMQKLAGIK